MSWLPGDVSNSQVLTPQDHLYAGHINELRQYLDNLPSTYALDDDVVHKAGSEIITGSLFFELGSFYDKGNMHYNALAYNVKNDGVFLYTGSITSGQNVLTATGASFTSSDVGKTISIVGGASGGGVLDATISSVTSSTQLVISTNASTTVSAAKILYGTDNSTAISNLIITVKNAGGGQIYFPKGVYCEKTNWSNSASRSSNIHFKGAGRGLTWFGLTGNVGLIGFGDFNADNNNISKNIAISDMSLDMLSRTSGFAHGITLGSTQDFTIDNIEVVGGSGGSGYQLAFGINAGGGSYQFTRNGVVSRSNFGESNQTNEAVSVLQANFIKFIGCTFRNKTSTYSNLSYSGWAVSYVGCNFYRDDSSGSASRGGLGINGFGGTNVTGCNFFGCGIEIYGGRVNISDFTIISYGTQTSSLTNPASNAVPFYGAGITFGASQNGTTEVGWDGGALGAIQQTRDIKISNGHIECSGNSALQANIFEAQDGTLYPSLKDLSASNITIRNTGHRGIELSAERLNLRDITVINSNQFDLGTERHNIAIQGTLVKMTNVRSVDDQTTKTVNYDLLIDQQANTLLVFPQMTFMLEDCEFERQGIQYYNGSFTTTQPTTVTIQRKNNIGESSSLNTIHEIGGNIKVDSLADPVAPTVVPYSYITDGVYTNGQNTLISSQAGFTSGDVGITVTGKYIPAGTTIASVAGNVATLSANITGGAGAYSLMGVKLGRSGSTTYNYYVYAEDRAGNKTLVSPVGTTTTGLATLNSVNGNKITVTPIPGAVRYHFTRSTTTAYIGFTSDKNLNYFIDNGQSTTTFSAPAFNNTGGIFAGSKFNAPLRTPATASATGTTGDIVWDSSYVYICVATNTWKRVAVTSW